MNGGLEAHSQIYSWAMSYLKLIAFSYGGWFKMPFVPVSKTRVLPTM